MDTSEVVPHEMQRNRVSVVFDFLAEPVGKARKPAHGHTHGEVLALHKRRADVFCVRMPGDFDLLRARAVGRAIAALRIGRVHAVAFYKLGKVDITAEFGFNCLPVKLQTV